MKKLVAALVLTTTPVLALANNTITFRGEITDQTCTIKVDNVQGNQTILLDSVNRTALTDAGKAGLKPFTITVADCTAAAANTSQALSVRFQGNVTANGNLQNQTGANYATNVAVQLTTKDGGKAIKFSSSGEAVSSLGSLTGTATGLSQEFGVQYVSDGGSPTVGTVLSTVQYAITYQ